MKPRDYVLAAELAEELRTNNALRHRLGVADGPEIIEADPSVVAFTDTEDVVVFLKVERYSGE